MGLIYFNKSCVVAFIVSAMVTGSACAQLLVLQTFGTPPRKQGKPGIELLLAHASGFLLYGKTMPVQLQNVQPDLATDDHSASSVVVSAQTAVGRNAPLVTSGLAQVVDQVTDSIVEILVPTQHLCLGTVVSKDGLIVTKASELVPDQMLCRFHNGHFAKLKLIATSTEDDLALLHVDPESLVDDQGNTFELNPIVFHSELQRIDTLQPGSLVVTVDARDNKPMMGIISIAGETFSIKNPECTDCIDLGLECVQSQLWQSQPNIQWNGAYAANTYKTVLVVQRVSPKTIAEQSGVLAGDFIEQFNGKHVSSQLELVEISKSLNAGDQVTFVVNRNNQFINLSTTISRNSKEIFHDRWGGGPFSRRRFGFTNVLTHDIPIQPDQCGGPLVDLHARTVGINVARSLRVATLAIPIEQVRQFVLANLADADLVTE